MPSFHPERWIFSDPRLGCMEAIVRSLPRGTGVVLRHHHLPASKRRTLLRRLGRLASARCLLLIDEGAGKSARVHNSRELRQALDRSAWPIFVSPLAPTRTHSDWKPLPRMRAAALARLGGRRVYALGGMSPTEFGKIKALGFVGWGAIDAWAKPGLRPRCSGQKGMAVPM